MRNNHQPRRENATLIEGLALALAALETFCKIAKYFVYKDRCNLQGTSSNSPHTAVVIVVGIVAKAIP